jgi:lysyl-tRNA synthetase, class II
VSAEPPEHPEAELPEQIRVRREKRAQEYAQGRDPYPVQVERTHSLGEIRAAHADLPPDTATGEVVGVTGRVIFLRNTGKLCFATLWGSRSRPDLVTSNDWPCPAAKQDRGTCRYACST